MEKNRKKLLIANSIASLIGQAITVTCGFVLTRLILGSFGSDVNGLVSSITQFLGFISFLEMGIGAVVKSALYEPLAKKDSLGISKVIASTKKFYRTIAIALVVYTLVLACIYPLISVSKFNYLYSFALIIIISISMFMQYYFGTPYQLLINADQKAYIPTITCAVTLLLNTLISGLLIMAGASIHVVKLSTSLIYVIRPVVYVYYVERKYKIQKNIVLTEEPIKQKWNGLAQHVAYVVQNQANVVILTLFSTLANVSIYTVYHNVTIGVQQIISCISVGFSAMLGNVLYSESQNKLRRVFEQVEWFFHFISTLLFTITGILIIPFVKVYTQGIDDAQYIIPIFSIVITLAQAVYAIRIPYETMILAANKFRETQMSAIVEVIINIGLSVALVNRIGLLGIAIGTLISMIYRTIYFIYYLHSNIICCKYKSICKNICTDLLVVIFSLVLCNCLFQFELQQISWTSWFVLAVKVSVTCLITSLVINLLIHKDHLDSLVAKMKIRFKLHKNYIR